MLCVYGHYKYLILLGPRSTLDYGRQILTSKVDLHIERVNITDEPHITISFYNID